MRHLISIITCITSLSLTSCAYQNAGIKCYERVNCVDKNGNKYQKMALKTALSADLPGISTMELNGVRLSFNPGTTTTQTPVYNRKGEVTNVITSSFPNGFYTSNVINAQGNAFAKTVDSGAAAATGILLSIGGAVVSSGTASALMAIPK